MSGWSEASAAGRYICCLAPRALMLALGCGKVSIMLLARGTARQHEWVSGASVGAGRGRGGRIVRQYDGVSLL